jgi:RNA polymerase sigma-70 factor (ECF subfamily)
VKDDPVRSARIRQFELQILPHVPDLYRIARRLGVTTSDAEDLVQETCLRAFRTQDQLRRPDAARPWLFAVFRSVFLRSVAKLRPIASASSIPLEVLPLPARWDDAREAGVERATLEDVREAISRLPLVYREALLLVHVAGFSYRELAQILDVPVGTVMSRLFRARRLVREALREASPRACSVERRR